MSLYWRCPCPVIVVSYLPNRRTTTARTSWSVVRAPATSPSLGPLPSCYPVPLATRRESSANVSGQRFRLGRPYGTVGAGHALQQSKAPAWSPRQSQPATLKNRRKHSKPKVLNQTAKGPGPRPPSRGGSRYPRRPPRWPWPGGSTAAGRTLG